MWKCFLCCGKLSCSNEAVANLSLSPHGSHGDNIFILCLTASVLILFFLNSIQYLENLLRLCFLTPSVSGDPSGGPDPYFGNHCHRRHPACTVCKGVYSLTSKITSHRAVGRPRRNCSASLIKQDVRSLLADLIFRYWMNITIIKAIPLSINGVLAVSYKTQCNQM